MRFALAAVGLLALAAARGQRLRFAARDHLALALQGVFLYGVSYVCVYQAERYVASGLVAVGYSASPLIVGIAAAMLFKAPIGLRFVCGGSLGLLGVALIFWPDLTGPSGNERAALGALFTVASVLLSSVGSLTASRNRSRGLPLLAAMGWGMAYGALAALLLALVLGRSLTLPSSLGWWLALLYLVLAGSVLAFACFLTLQDRVGVGRAGAVGVMTPLLALVVSLLWEGFRPTPLTFAGAALAVVGNAMMLLPPTPATSAAPAEG